MVLQSQTWMSNWTELSHRSISTKSSKCLQVSKMPANKTRASQHPNMFSFSLLFLLPSVPSFLYGAFWIKVTSCDLTRRSNLWETGAWKDGEVRQTPSESGLPQFQQWLQLSLPLCSNHIVSFPQSYRPMDANNFLFLSICRCLRFQVSSINPVYTYVKMSLPQVSKLQLTGLSASCWVPRLYGEQFKI